MEIRRLLYDKRNISMIVLLLLLSMVMFFYPSAGGEVPQQQTGKQVEDIIEESDRYGGISLFADTDSFAYKNVQKTKADYTRILSVDVQEADTSFFDSLISCETVNYLLFAIGFLIALSYTDPVSQGLKGMTYAAKNGRGRRRIRQILVLMAWSGIAVVLLYGGAMIIWLLGTGAEGGKILAFPLQTMSLGRLLPFRITVFTYMMAVIFFRWLVLFQFVLILWFAFLLLEHVILACGAVTILFLAEYVIWQVIGVNSSYHLWKYCNLWYQLSSNEYLYTYFNMNIAGYPVGRYFVIFVQILLVGVLLSAVAYWKGEYSKSGGISVRISLSLPFGRRIQEKLTLLTAEMYKLLVMQKGFLLILLFAAFIVNQSDFMNVTNTGYQDLYYDFMEQYEGEPSEESEQYIRSFAKEVNQVSKEYEEAEEQYAQGMLSDDAYIAASMKYESYENEREFLAMIEHQQNYLQKLKKEQGISGWYVNTYCYQSIFQPVISLKYGLLLVFTLLTAVSSAKIEADAGTINVLNSTRLGRRQLLYKKVLAVSLTAGIMYAILLAVTLGSAVSVYGISVPDAPVQSLEWYAGLPLPVSLLQWMILYYGMILLVLLLVSIGFTLLFQKVFRHA